MNRKYLIISKGACGLTVYSKQGVEFNVGVKKTSASRFEIYTIERGEDPKYFITVTEKKGNEITDDVIESHVQLFFS